MKLIAHRGNMNGPNPERENTVSYIVEAITLGYDVEVDVWYDPERDIFQLGHDKPDEIVTAAFLKSPQIWCHAKDIVTLRMLHARGTHCFIHDIDPATLTSDNHIWIYPGMELVPDSICVLPELGYNGEIKRCYGICSDYVTNYTHL